MKFKKFIKHLLGYIAYYIIFPEFLIKILHKARGVNFNNVNTIYIGYNVLLDDTMPEIITIEDYCWIGRDVSIFAHLNIPGNLEKQFNRKKIGKVKIGYGTFIGPRAIILPGVTIGKYAVVGIGTVVTENVPDNGIVFGNPARLFGKTKT
ncbi:MAG: acyltransferase [Elusimicrobia bacterium]|nr:acyltransferase [Elusimicrobiota bacterium]